MNRRGFTLVELLVTIAILGIITGLSIPLVRNIQRVQVEKRYNMYLDNLNYAAKLYTDSYEDDLYGAHTNGCTYITYEQLASRNLIKDIDIADISCNSQYTIVKVIRYGGKYYYKPYIGCGSKINGKASNPDLFKPAKATVEEECDANKDVIINLVAVPDKDNSASNKTISPRVNIVSSTGVNHDKKPKIFYGYSYGKNNNVINGWNRINFRIPTNREQEKSILQFKQLTFPSLNNLSTPTNITGDLYLVLRVDFLEDADGNSWKEKTVGKEYLYFGPYRLDNTKPTFNSSTIISSSSTYQSTIPQLKFTAFDEKFSEEKDLKICYSYEKDECSTTINNKYTKYEKNQKLNSIPGGYDGKDHDIFVTIADAAGNIEKKTFKYHVAKSYKLTFDPNGGGKCDHDSIGQIENKPWKELVVNEEGLNVNTFCKTTRKGYSLVGWFKKADGTGGEVKETDIATADLKVYAKWKANTYKLSYNSNGGTSCSPKDIKYNEAYGTLCTPTRSGYTFLGWYTAASGGTKVDANTKMGESNTTIYAQWNAVPKTTTKTTTKAVVKYTIKLAKDSSINKVYINGKETTSLTVVKGTKVTISCTPKVYYRFTKWSDGSTAVTRTYTVNSNVTLTAQGTHNKIILNYYANGGKLSCGPKNICCNKISCSKSACPTAPKANCKGATGLIYVSDDGDSYSSTAWSKAGLRDYVKKSGASLYLTRSKYRGTRYWLVGSGNSKVKISETKTFATALKLLEACGTQYANRIRTQDVTVNLYAEWR